MTHATNVGLRVMSLFVATILLSGCFEATKRAAGVQPVCTALMAPIRYNSTNPKSRRHAGPDLAPDLNKRNQVGIALRCPSYR